MKAIKVPLWRRPLGAFAAIGVLSVASASCGGQGDGPMSGAGENDGGVPMSDGSNSPEATAAEAGDAAKEASEAPGDASGDAAGDANDAAGDAAGDAGDATVEAAAGADAAIDVSGPDAHPDGGPTEASASDAGPDATALRNDGGGDAAADGSGDESPCSSTQLYCAGLCVPNDPVNCGACGHDCTALHATSAASCMAGQCTFPGLTCAPGWGHCSNNAGDGCEASLTSAAHCGSCTLACTSPPICSVGGTNPACVHAVAVAVGTKVSYALLSNGSVDAWGYDSGGFQSYTQGDGMLGDNAPIATETAKPSPVSSTTTAVAIAGGDSHACALLGDGTVECWGDNTVGELGINPGSTKAARVPAAVPGLTNVTAIDVGGTISCALIAGGTVKCWGYNTDGELGNPTTASCNGVDKCSATPVAVTGLSGVKAIAIGNGAAILADHACALLNDGTVKCWGYNGDGEVGNGTITATGGVFTPVVVSGITTATAIQAHQYGACALLSGGSVKCWGSGANGELGNGSTNTAPTPVTVSGLTDAQSLSMGSSAETVCAVRTNGHAVCWGFNGNAQLGSGAPSSTVQSSTPVPVSGLTNVKQIGGGTYNMCATLTTGEVSCWGDNGSSELGNAAAVGNYNPVPVTVIW